jgi:lipopolysaccharide/colanic/teichoic acid biosynthesis glycosyltransferase
MTMAPCIITAIDPVQEFPMLDFYYTERLAARRPADTPLPLLERLRGVRLPLGYLALRRVAELMLIVVTLPVTLPLALATALCITLDSRGPILFRQKRRGRDGAIFMIAKFRSMYVGEGSGARLTMPGDPRVTRVGRFIRRHHIDELPQLWNVVKGDMSLIGPRPEPLPVSDRCEEVYPLFHYRYMIKPGVTGWSQVNLGYTSEIADVGAKLEHDFHYILNIGPKLDLRIVLRTFHALLTGFGAR